MQRILAAYDIEKLEMIHHVQDQGNETANDAEINTLVHQYQEIKCHNLVA